MQKILTRYPDGKKASAVLPLLHLAQRQNSGHISPDVIEYLATLLPLSTIKIQEVVSFYSMFYQKPVGKYLIQICGTTPCMLRGSENLQQICYKKLGIKNHETTTDGNFTLVEVECLGACTGAPVVQINDNYYENLTEDSLVQLLETLS